MPFRNKVTGQYPVSHDQVRKANPTISFPKYFETAEGYDWVNFTQIPSFDPSTHFCREISPVQQDDQWNQAWEVVAYTEEEIAARNAAQLNELKNSASQSIQEALDAFARERGYDNILSACTYATSANTTFAAEGQRAIELRDATWTKLYEIFTEIDAGTRSDFEYEDNKDEFPALTWE